MFHDKPHSVLDLLVYRTFYVSFRDEHASVRSFEYRTLNFCKRIFRQFSIEQIPCICRKELSVRLLDDVPGKQLTDCDLLLLLLLLVCKAPFQCMPVHPVAQSGNLSFRNCSRCTQGIEAPVAALKLQLPYNRRIGFPCRPCNSDICSADETLTSEITGFL